MPSPVISSQPTYHILIVIPSLRGGGAERVACNLAKRWVYDGHEVSFITQTTPDTDVYTLDKRIQRYSTQDFEPCGKLGQVKRIYALRQAFKRLRPDMVVAMMTTPSIMSLAAAVGLPCKVIATEHAYPPSQTLSGFWQWMRQRLYPQAAAVVALTQSTVDYLKQRIPKAHYETIPNAVTWPLVDQEPHLTKPKPSGKKWLLGVGRLHKEKGFDRLIEAFAPLAKTFPDWDLIILGEGQERQALTDQVQALGLQDRVFLMGRAGNMAWWYKRADVYVLSSRFEGMSNTLQEAMAAGLPCVAMDCDVGPREIIRSGIDGVLVDQHDPVNALRQALEDLLNDQQAMQRYAANAPQVQERFSMRKVDHQWNGLFKAICPPK